MQTHTCSAMMLHSNVEYQQDQLNDDDDHEKIVEGNRLGSMTSHLPPSGTSPWLTFDIMTGRLASCIYALRCNWYSMEWENTSQHLYTESKKSTYSKQILSYSSEVRDMFIHSHFTFYRFCWKRNNSTSEPHKRGEQSHSGWRWSQRWRKNDCWAEWHQQPVHTESKMR